MENKFVLWSTYGEAGSLFSGVALRAGPSCELVDIREGEEIAAVGWGGGGASVGQFFGLGSRVTCGEDKGAAVAGATAVDMVVTVMVMVMVIGIYIVKEGLCLATSDLRKLWR